MKHVKCWLCLLGFIVLLGLSACSAAPAEVSQPVQVSPFQEVVETVQTSEAPEPTASVNVQPQHTREPAQTQENREEPTTVPASTSAPTAQPTQKPEPTPQPTQTGYICYLSIECKTILTRMEDLVPGKESLVPEDGVILAKTAVSVQEGETVFDVLQRAAKSHSIHMEYSYTPGFGSHYIEGINNLYEFDCGAGSGWMYFVNGVKSNYGVSKYTVKAGDVIQFKYTCDSGFDL